MFVQCFCRLGRPGIKRSGPTLTTEETETTHVYQVVGMPKPEITDWYEVFRARETENTGLHHVVGTPSS